MHVGVGEVKIGLRRDREEVQAGKEYYHVVPGGLEGISMQIHASIFLTYTQLKGIFFTHKQTKGMCVIGNGVN